MTGQLALDWTNTTMTSPKTTKPHSARSRGFSQAKQANPEYVDIGPYVGKRPVVALTAGSNKCQCGRCGLAFTSPSGFDKHQRLTKAGEIICLSPETVGLIERDGWWSFPPDPRFTPTTDPTRGTA